MGRRAGALVILALVAASGALSACGGRAAGASPGADGTVVLEVHYSAFSTKTITVEAGQTVRFVIVNRDPIPHELIVGDQAVQDRHEKGTEAAHGERPGEVSVAPGGTSETTVTFTAHGKGRLLFGCHLPGHWDYGMRGTIRVV